MTSVGAVLASALRKVVGDRLRLSGLGEVWRDDRTWFELAREIDAALRQKLVLVDKKTYDALMADAAQMKVVRGFVEEYEKRRPKDQKKNSGRNKNAYAQWAAENMPPKEGT